MAPRPRRRLPERRPLAGLRAIPLFLALSGCEPGPAGTYECACSYLTDFDDASKMGVSVCAPTEDRASSFARGCAQSEAHAPVQECACHLVSHDKCRIGECRAK